MKHFLIIGLIFCSVVSYGQKVIDVDKMEAFKIIPMETVFIHQNASTVFSGEKLYYKMYCVNAENNRLSPISKIGYVELVGPDKRRIFRHKIKLIDGLGQGDFFLPADISTGNYKLLGYTQWMKNNPEIQYFTSDVNIINLYRVNVNSFVVEKDSISIDSSRLKNATSSKDFSLTTTNINKNLQVTVDKKRFNNREKVKVNIVNLLGKEGYGNYSLSVKKRDDIIDSPKGELKASLLTKSANNTIFHLPELRGALLSGRIVSKNKSSSVESKKVALSVPDKDFLFKMSNTNSKGEFYFNLDEEYDASNVFVQIFENDKEEYEILFEDNSIDYDPLDFNKLSISEEKRGMIQQRNIHSQIENAYLAAKQDTLATAVASNAPFYMDFDQVYNLDDYTRFSTIQETLVEIIENVWIRKDGNGNSFFHVRGNEYVTNFDFLPLIIVDGIMLQNHSDLLNIDARRIKKISIARSEHEFALQLFRGIIAFDTFEGNIDGLFDKGYIQKIEWTAPLSTKRYFNPSYETSNENDKNRVPDYRYQLLWLPNLMLKENSTKVEFFTSDVNGTYEVSLKGFTWDGTAISIQETFEVE